MRLAVAALLFSFAPVFVAGAQQVDPHDGPLFNESYYDAIEAHVVAHVGEFDTVWHEVFSPDIHVDILPIPPSAEAPFWTLVTAGMSYRPMTMSKEIDGDASLWSRAELLIALPPDWFGDEGPGRRTFDDEAIYYPVRLLKGLARYPHNNATWLGPGHTVNNGERLGPGTSMSATMIHWPLAFDDAFPSLQMADGEIVNFYAVYPIYDAERSYAMANGTDALLEQILQADTDLWPLNPTRESAVPQTD